MNKIFYFTAAAVALLLGAAAWGINALAPASLPVMVYALIAAYALLTIFLYRYITRAVQASPRRFVTAVTGSITIKLLFSALIMGLYIWLKGPGKVAVAISLFVIYVVYTVLLISRLVKDSRNKVTRSD